LGVEGICALQPALQANRTLKQLHLFDCQINDECIRLLADAPVGNTTIEVFDVGTLTSDCLARVLETTRIKTIGLFFGNYYGL
jgi:hypothetical protein